MNSRTTNGILQEISNYGMSRSKDDAVAMRAQHAISSAIFIFEMIDNLYTAEESDQLKRRFLNSIKSGEPERFARSVKKLKESKEK